MPTVSVSKWIFTYKRHLFALIWGAWWVLICFAQTAVPKFTIVRYDITKLVGLAQWQ